MIRLFLFDNHGMGLRKRILANARHLPGNLESRAATSNLKTMLGNLFRDIEIRTRSADCRELVPEITVKGLELFRQWNPGSSGVVQFGQPIVDIHHIRRFNKGVGEVFVFGAI